MLEFLSEADAVSITEASRRGIAAVARDAAGGHDIVLSRHGRPVAALVGMRHFSELQEMERDFRSLALVASRIATDDGKRHDLNDVIAAFGLDRAELEAELDAEPNAAG